MRGLYLRLPAALFLAGAYGSCDELVTNGNFGAINTGFTSDYLLVQDFGQNCAPAGVYTIGTNPISCNSGWATFAPFDPSGNMMMVNGHPPPAGSVVWSETVSVVPNSLYTFSAYAAPNAPGGPTLNFTVNGTQVGGTLAVSNAAGTWTRFAGTWNSSASTTAILRIVQVGVGDFSLDDVSFSGPAAGTVTRSLPHVAAGASFGTGFYVVNSGAAPANFTINFYDDTGAPAVLAFGPAGASSTLSGTIPSNGAAYYETSNTTGILASGSAVFHAGSQVSAQALFRRLGPDGNYYEAAVPSTTGSFEFQVPFDATIFPANGLQIFTGIALANIDPVTTANVTCMAHDSSGNLIQGALTVPPINPLGHWAFYNFGALYGKRGILDCSSNVKLGAIGIRALGSSISSLPIIPIR